MVGQPETAADLVTAVGSFFVWHHGRVRAGGEFCRQIPLGLLLGEPPLCRTDSRAVGWLPEDPAVAPLFPCLYRAFL